MSRKRRHRRIGDKRSWVEPMSSDQEQEREDKQITQNDVVAVAKGILALMFLAFVFYVLFS